MERVDERTIRRLNGPAWAKIRPLFKEVSDTLLSVCSTTWGELVTVYIKYASVTETDGQPYAVVWVRKSTEMVVGLSMPDSFRSAELTDAPPRHVYNGLTGYLRLTPGDPLPDEFGIWAAMAFENRKAQPGRAP